MVSGARCAAAYVSYVYYYRSCNEVDSKRIKKLNQVPKGFEPPAWFAEQFNKITPEMRDKGPVLGNVGAVPFVLLPDFSPPPLLGHVEPDRAATNSTEKVRPAPSGLLADPEIGEEWSLKSKPRKEKAKAKDKTKRKLKQVTQPVDDTQPQADIPPIDDSRPIDDAQPKQQKHRKRRGPPGLKELPPISPARSAASSQPEKTHPVASTSTGGASGAQPDPVPRPKDTRRRTRSASHTHSEAPEAASPATTGAVASRSASRAGTPPATTPGGSSTYEPLPPDEAEDEDEAMPDEIPAEELDPAFQAFMEGEDPQDVKQRMFAEGFFDVARPSSPEVPESQARMYEDFDDVDMGSPSGTQAAVSTHRSPTPVAGPSLEPSTSGALGTPPLIRTTPKKVPRPNKGKAVDRRNMNDNPSDPFHVPKLQGTCLWCATLDVYG